MAVIALFLTLATPGMINAGYLMYNHHQKKPLICPMTHDCSKVTESKHTKLFGIRNEILGFLFYNIISTVINPLLFITSIFLVE